MEIPLGRDLDTPLYLIDTDDEGHWLLLQLIGMHEGEPVYAPYVAEAE